MNIPNNNNNTATDAGTDSTISPGTTSTSDSCKDSASSKSNSDDVCDVNDMLKNMSTAADDKDIIVSICANCGKEGYDVNNICNKCKLAKYCNAACKKKHRHKHKKDCEEHIRLAAERAAELHDEKLFKKQPSQCGDCPICFLLLPTLDSGRIYMSCCGKVICCGCAYAPIYDNQGNKVDTVKQNECPFCRVAAPKSNEEANERIIRLVEKNDAEACYNLGLYYFRGTNGFPQDYNKALKLWHRAGELGDAKAYTNIGSSYNNGQGVEVDKKEAELYYELAAIGGSANARFNLGVYEYHMCNMERALRHLFIAVGAGYNDSLEHIKDLYLNGHATKEDYMKALRLYQEYLSEIKSIQRDKAAAADDQCRYY